MNHPRLALAPGQRQNLQSGAGPALGAIFGAVQRYRQGPLLLTFFSVFFDSQNIILNGKTQLTC